MIAAASTAFFPHAARADQVQTSITAGIGFFFGFNLGPREGVEWGFEGFVTQVRDVTTCRGVPTLRSALGAMAQVGVVGKNQPRVSLMALGGREIARDGASFTGEIGLSYRGGPDPGPGIHFGITPALGFVDVYGRAELLLDDYSFGMGIRPMPIFRESDDVGCTVTYF
jgi:hypothetical protein